MRFGEVRSRGDRAAPGSLKRNTANRGRVGDTLIATKAARISWATEGDPVLEFGLRRAQEIDRGLAASRAAYIGGCAATSNVLAGKQYGIPVRGTHAHSWVTSFDDETEAFDSYAEAMPNNCVLLVDTYDTLEGVRKAVEVGKRLRERGHEMVGIRLDSGDLAYLSIAARKLTSRQAAMSFIAWKRVSGVPAEGRAFAMAFLSAANLGDDTDTTGAVAGALLGLRFGLEQIPNDWVESLARLSDVQRLIERFRVACLQNWGAEQ